MCQSVILCDEGATDFNRTHHPPCLSGDVPNLADHMFLDTELDISINLYSQQVKLHGYVKCTCCCTDDVCVNTDGTVCVSTDGIVCVSLDGTVCVSTDGIGCVSVDGIVCVSADGTDCVNTDDTICVGVDGTNCVNTDDTICVGADGTVSADGTGCSICKAWKLLQKRSLVCEFNSRKALAQNVPTVKDLKIKHLTNKIFFNFYYTLANILIKKYNTIICVKFINFFI